MTSRPTWVAGNWKMNLLRAEARRLAAAVNAAASEHPGVLVGVFPAYTALDVVRIALNDGPVVLGGQSCHDAEKGAHTAEISAAMLVDAGCTAVLCGHSERRAAGVGDAEVGRRARAAVSHGLRAVLCVGEQLDDRDAGRTEEVLLRQFDAALAPFATADLDLIDLAYEPVWAIGTGKTATPEIAAAAHAVLRARLVEKFGDAGAEPRILYGGSVKPSNARELMGLDGVNGVLVGGAALVPESFTGIIEGAV
jgi:triosephosphate isomerase (TIM)